MSSNSIQLDTLNPILTDLLALVESSLQVAQQAEAKAAALASQEPPAPVVLEKVAAVSDEVLNGMLDTLTATGYLEDSERETVSKAIKADPTVALKIASRIATISTAADPQGSGVAKAASKKTAESDPDGWNEVVAQ